MKEKILVVEDDNSISELIKIHLIKNNFDHLIVADGEEAIPSIENFMPDLVILDWMIPNLSGIEILKRLRLKSEFADLPVLMLTAKNSEQDKILGFESGVDDYLTKPFIPSELIARINAILKRSRNKTQVSNTIQFQEISIDQSQKKVFRQDRKINLGPTEYNILLFLVKNKQRVFSRDQILNKIWPHNVHVDARTVDVHIRRLRKQLNLPGEIDYIRTVRSAGYSIDIE
ncbi:MAG: winged helix-turn-helix domain-containing protein [Pelagibacteraceae bacterium]